MPKPDHEIELKLLCEPRDLDAVLAAAPTGTTESKALAATYFDTPDEALAKAHIALRVRESGGRRVQTLKAGAGFAREEHEMEINGVALDLTMPALKAALKPAARRRLSPVYQVAVQRRTRQIRHGQARIELALDQGEVRAGALTSPICEVELELKAGSPAALFDLARSLSRAAPLYLSFESKSARGQALIAGREGLARKSDKAALTPGLTAAEAFQAVTRDALAQVAANASLLRDAGGVEVLHQLRVALRRLRSAISTFGEIVGDPQVEAVKTELKWLTAACDEARNLDVFAQDNLRLADGDAERLEPAVEAARARAHAKAAAAVASKRFRDLLLEASAWIETGPWLEGPGKAQRERDRPVERFAAKALERRTDKLLRRGRRLTRLDDAARHRLRIGAKKLRYALESFAPLFPARPTERFIRRLKDLQDQLGALNDAAVAARVVERLHPEGAELEAAEHLLAARAEARPDQLAAAAKAMGRLADTARPWRA